MTAAATATATDDETATANLDWYLENSSSVVSRLAVEFDVHEDTVSSIAYNMMGVGMWPSVAPEASGYAEAYTAMVRGVVHKYCTSVENNKAYFEQADAVGRYKARRTRFDDNGRSFVDFSKGGATKRGRRV